MTSRSIRATAFETASRRDAQLAGRGELPPLDGREHAGRQFAAHLVALHRGAVDRAAGRDVDHHHQLALRLRPPLELRLVAADHLGAVGFDGAAEGIPREVPVQRERGGQPEH